MKARDLTDAPRLSAAQARLVRDLHRKGGGFKGAYGWRFKGDLGNRALAVGNALIEAGLAFEQSGAPAMLKLTPRGCVLGANLCRETRREARS